MPEESFYGHFSCVHGEPVCLLSSFLHYIDYTYYFGEFTLSTEVWFTQSEV